MEWSNSKILKSIGNTCNSHVHIIETPELSFLGFPEQPDFANLRIEIEPCNDAVELKSVKKYLKQFRQKHISYERLLDTIFNDFWTVYSPLFLSVTIHTRPRGGISSTLTKRKGRMT